MMASSTFFHKPELALRRALELEGINQSEAALTLLHEVLSSRRHRTWSLSYEDIMITYLNLCLKLHKSREAKDGLHQYRNLSQSQAPGSLEKVILYLMEKAEEKCAKAKASADAQTITITSGDDDEDGFGASPQAILLSTMSTDPAKSQRDSTLLLPSLKFLWETYRAILDILRSNSKLEHVYHSAATGALRFCRLYKRRMEFRHLCDMLRMHLGNLKQYGNIKNVGEDGKTNSKVRGWEGWTTEAIELHLQTRFTQLETASVLHRYTEGFRTVEDIYNILQISQARRKTNPDLPPPKAKLMAAYYEKLTTLFWVSENYLFHAFAWYKYYTLCREYNKGMSVEQKQMQASAVLLAALCIPTLPNKAGNSEEKSHEISSTIEDDIVKQKMGRMATLLGFHTRNPSRDALLFEIKTRNILDQVPQYLRDLYYLLEKDSDPLVLVEKARPLLVQLKSEMAATTMAEPDKDSDDENDDKLGRYVKPLTSVLLLKLLLNLSTAYHTVSMDHVKKLTAGLDMSFEQVETAIVLFTQSKALSVRIDHRAGCLRFGDAQLESDVMRSQITVMSKQLEHVCRILNPPNNSDRDVRRTALYRQIRANLQSEHSVIIERKNLIEKRKEESERLAQEKVRNELRVKKEEEAARKAEEENRINKEKFLREQEKAKKIQREMENMEKKRFLVAMGHKTDSITEEEMSKIDTLKLQKEHQDKIDKKREEVERKTKETAKKLDYLVRAIRIEELPLVKKKYEENMKKDRERYEAEVSEKAKKAKEQWEADVKDKGMLQEHGVFDFLNEFEEAMMAGRVKKHAEACAKADEEAEIEAERSKIQRAQKRKEEAEERQAEEKKRVEEEEEKRKQEEEKQKREEAKQEREAKEEAARKAEMARMQEERNRKSEAQERRAPPSSRDLDAAQPPSETGGKYLPPSRRSRAADDRGGGVGGSRFGDRGGPGGYPGGGGGYPGGGRYEGRREDDRGRGGGHDDRRGGGFDDRRGGGDRGGGDRGGYARSDDRSEAPRENQRWR